jgi:hypothetical protein
LPTISGPAGTLIATAPTGGSIGSTSTDVVSIGTATLTGASSPLLPSIADNSFQAVSELASDPAYAFNIPGTTPVNLPSGPLPGVLGTPENVIGYWGYNDDFGNGYYDYVSSTVDSTPFFNNPSEGFRLLSENPPSKISAPPTTTGGSSGISPDAFVLSLGGMISGSTTGFSTAHGNVGNRAVIQQAAGRTGLQILSPRYGDFGAVDLLKAPPATGAKGPRTPSTNPTGGGTKTVPPPKINTKAPPPAQSGPKAVPKSKVDIKIKPMSQYAAKVVPLNQHHTENGPSNQDSIDTGPLRNLDKGIETRVLRSAENRKGPRSAGRGNVATSPVPGHP